MGMCRNFTPNLYKCLFFIVLREIRLKMFYYQTDSWVRMNLVLGKNHLDFGYESSVSSQLADGPTRRC